MKEETRGDEDGKCELGWVCWKLARGALHLSLLALFVRVACSAHVAASADAPGAIPAHARMFERAQFEAQEEMECRRMALS